jgi:signal-transduction protein with cAMP-binding, CBS, and nucleotidyltransferase domain
MKFLKELNLNAEDMADLIGAFKIEQFDANEAIIEVGTEGTKFYIIMKGTVSVLIDNTEKRI